MKLKHDVRGLAGAYENIVKIEITLRVDSVIQLISQVNP